MLDRQRRIAPAATERRTLLAAVAEAMQRFAKSDRTDGAAGAAHQLTPTPPSPAAVRCPSCGQASTRRPTYYGLQLCPRCGSALPRQRAGDAQPRAGAGEGAGRRPAASPPEVRQ